MKYVISDLHGCYDKFIKMLELIEFKQEDIMYILGDVIDRGEDSIKLLQYIMKQSNMELLMGNHCEMMLQALVNQESGYYSCWMSNGGYSTLNQFNKLSPTRQEEILAYLQTLKLYKIVDNFMLVHAGVDFESGVNQIRETLLWARDEFIESNLRFQDKIVIFGHSPTHYMQPKIKPMKIWHGKGKIGIDCGCVFNGGQLGCLRLDDMEEFYV